MRSLISQQSALIALAFCSSALGNSSTPDDDCQCRDASGTMRNLGTIECVNITGEQYLVRCEMSTNTPFWKKLENGAGCPLS